MDKDKVAVVVITFNRLELVKETIRGIRAQTREPDKIIVVNNSSTDGTGEWLKQQHDLEVITQSNVGSSGGQYTGIKYAYEQGYDWIWTMDDDVEPEPDCLESLLSANSKYQVRAPLRYTDKGKPFLNDAIDFNLSNPFASFWKGLITENDLEMDVIEATGITFEGPLLHRSVVEKTGLPDKNFFIFADDTEYFIRAAAEGFDIGIVTGARLNRKLPVSEVSRGFSWKHYYVIRNIIAIHVMHGSGPVRWIKPFGYLLLWLARCRKIKDIGTTFRAFKDGFFYKKEI